MVIISGLSILLFATGDRFLICFNIKTLILSSARILRFLTGRRGNMGNMGNMGTGIKGF